MTNIQGTAIIRDRGQLTIPENIRKGRSWVSSSSAVTISSSKPNEIVIKPAASVSNYDWERIWRKIELARSFKGKNTISLSKFIAKDRETRR